jgi:putative FmdB family regulatory protein
MPIFEYECEKCGEKFEYFQWAGEDAASLKCPKCGETKTKRVMSTFPAGKAVRLASIK